MNNFNAEKTKTKNEMREPNAVNFVKAKTKSDAVGSVNAKTNLSAANHAKAKTKNEAYKPNVVNSAKDKTKSSMAKPGKTVQMQLIIDGINVDVTLKKVKRGRLSIDENGGVKLAAPFGVETKRLEELICSKAEWMRRHLEKAAKHKPMERQFVSGEFVYLLGEKYGCVVNESKTNRIMIEGGVMNMCFKPDVSREKKFSLLHGLFKQALQEVIEERLIYWEQKTGLKCSVWRIRQMKSCWGSCNPTSKSILFSLALAKKPPICIDYIIVHELGHMVSRLHDKTFKQFLDLHMPSWRQIKRSLNTKISDYRDFNR